MMTMLDAINDIRARAGLPALRPNGQLTQAATRHVNDLASGRVGLGNSHIGSDGSTVADRVDDVGYEFWDVSEITGWGWGNWGINEQMAYWLGSDPHKAIIYNPDFIEAGAAYIERPGGKYTRFWVVVFGVPVDAPVPSDHVVYVPVVTGPAAQPPATGIDLLRFKLADPDCWRVVRMTAADGSEHSEDVQDMELGGGLFVRRKNVNAEWHRYDDSYFYLVHDTSPGVGTEGIPRVYTLYKDGQPGAPKSRRFQAVGVEWVENGLHRVVFRSRSGCYFLQENSGEAQNRSLITHIAHNYTFNRYGQGLTFDAVLFEKTGVETQLYGIKDGRSCGWIGWSSPWGWSEPVELHWDRGRMTGEPDRCCGWD